MIAGRFDRFFPLEFVQRIARERLGVEPEVVNSGHLPALACPDELAALLLDGVPSDRLDSARGPSGVPHDTGREGYSGVT